MKIPVNKKRFWLYIWIGSAYLFFWAFHDLINQTPTFFKRLVNNVWLIAYIVMLNFILFEYVLPFIKFTWKRLLLVPFLVFAMLMLYSFGVYWWRFVGVELHIYTALRVHASVEEGTTYHAPYSFGSIVFFGILRHIYDYRKLKQATQLLRIEKQEAELNYLKSQTNPHFLFNTLNNIYSLARDKSPLAPESIMRLSKIMRFMLYDTSGDFISIEQELKVINDYIALEKLRYDTSLVVDFNYDIEDMKQALPPLLLIPLVENAFKHGVSETRDRPFINIHLSVNNRRLNFVVKNSADEGNVGRHIKENIGLSNLRRQLELQYKEYELTANQDGKIFIAQMKINLATHV